MLLLNHLEYLSVKNDKIFLLDFERIEKLLVLQ